MPLRRIGAGRCLDRSTSWSLQPGGSMKVRKPAVFGQGSEALQQQCRPRNTSLVMFSIVPLWFGADWCGWCAVPIGTGAIQPARDCFCGHRRHADGRQGAADSTARRPGSSCWRGSLLVSLPSGPRT